MSPENIPLSFQVFVENYGGIITVLFIFLIFWWNAIFGIPFFSKRPYYESGYLDKDDISEE